MLNWFKLYWVNHCGSAVLSHTFTFLHTWSQSSSIAAALRISAGVRDLPDRRNIQHREASVQSLIHLLCLRTCSASLLYCESDLSSKSNMPAYIWLLSVQRLSVLHVCTCSDIIICVKTYRCSWPIFRCVDYNHMAQEVWKDQEERIWENCTRFKAPLFLP